MLVTQKGILNNIESITGMLAFGADVVDAFFFGWRGGGFKRCNCYRSVKFVNLKLSNGNGNRIIMIIT